MALLLSETAMASVSPLAGVGLKTEEAGNWQSALDAAIPAIVVIRVAGVRPFDGNGANYSFATGFVVNKAKGIILTNRHVITAGPVTADAIFLNKEEVDLQPLYRDPVHDFGFFRFKPSDLKYQKLSEIELDPDGARVGREIRVVGNDNGEKLSILPGILARTDREAPFYGSNDYNDFNTFYLAAASSNSGGSSGSPVLTIEGKAIALNCGAAKKAASSFYLPLHRIKRALDLLVEGQPVPRGTLQTVFKHMAFDEVRRLGLTSEVESQVRERFPIETGMLVVEQVIPKGPGDGRLEPGDVVVEVNGEWCTTFLPLADCFDSQVGCIVHLRVQRGGEERVVEVPVQDLHSIIPDEFFQVSSGVVHPLSYHHAKNYNLQVGGVYMASSGYMLARAGINVHCIITSVGGKPTPTLDDFQAALESFPDGTRTSLQWFGLTDRNRLRTAIITVDRKWFPMGRSKRTDPTWQFTPALDAPPPPSPSPSIESRKRRRLNKSLDNGHSTTNGHIHSNGVVPMAVSLPTNDDASSPLPEKSDRLRNALVMVSFDVPYMVNGISSSEYLGAGVVFDKENGLVLVDRTTVPMALGDVMVTVSGVVEVPGEVLFVHPIHNFAVVKYDPAALNANHVDVCEATFSEQRLCVGDATTFYGLTTPFVPVYQRAVVTRLEILKLLDGRPPQYVGSNTEVIFFDRVASCTGGIFEGPDGNVAALWLCFAYQHDNETKQVYRGVPVEIVQDTVSLLKGLKTPVPRTISTLPVKFSTVELAKARAGLGLSEEVFLEAQARCRLSHGESSLLVVRRLAAGGKASQGLMTGDVVLSVDDQLVLRPFEVEEACRGKTCVGMRVLRNHEETAVSVTVDELDTLGTSRVILWSGLFLQEPHLPALLMGYVPEEGGGVYISRWSYGSPAQKYGLRATMWIVEVNGTPTPDLDTFLTVTSKIGDHTATRLKTKDLDGKTKVFTLRPSYEYWPTLEVHYSFEARKWELKHHFSTDSPTLAA